MSLDKCIASFTADDVRAVLFQIMWTLYACQQTWQGFRIQTSSVSSLFNNINVYKYTKPRYFQTYFNSQTYTFRVGTPILPVVLNLNYFATTLDPKSQLATGRPPLDDISDATDILRMFAAFESSAFDVARQMLVCKCTPLVHILTSFGDFSVSPEGGDAMYIV